MTSEYLVDVFGFSWFSVCFNYSTLREINILLLCCLMHFVSIALVVSFYQMLCRNCFHIYSILATVFLYLDKYYNSHLQSIFVQFVHLAT